jgi:hypothetical protein
MLASPLASAALFGPQPGSAGGAAPGRWLARLWRLSRCTVVLVPGGVDTAGLLQDDLLPWVARRAGDRRHGMPASPARKGRAPQPPRQPELALLWSADTVAPPGPTLQRLLPPSAQPGEPPTALGALAQWHRQTGGRLLVAVTGAEGWLASGPAQAAHDAHAAAWLELLRHPGLPVHMLLALDERCEPWLARWRDHWPDLGEQTLRLAQVPQAGRALRAPEPAEPAVDPALESAMAAAVRQAIATAAAAPVCTDRPLSRRVVALAGAAVLLAGAAGVWRGQTSPAPAPTQRAAAAAAAAPGQPLAALLPEVAAAAGLVLVSDLASLRPGSLAWVGYDTLAAAWRDRAPPVQVLAPLLRQDLRFTVAEASPLRFLHQASGLPLTAADPRARAAALTAWPLVLGQAPVFVADGPLRVSLGDAPAPGWRVLAPDPAHAGTARARRQLLPAADGGFALLSYLVVGAGQRAPTPAALQRLGQAWCAALPRLQPSDAAAWRSLQLAPPLPAPWPDHPAAAGLFASCAPLLPTPFAGAPRP